MLLAGRIFAVPDRAGPLLVRPRHARDGSATWMLSESVPCFLAEHAADPTRPPDGTRCVAVSVPPHGPPRPIRLGVQDGETVRPLAD